jgi:hypothetical protein
MNKKSVKIFVVLTVALLLVLRKMDTKLIGFDLQDMIASTANNYSFSKQQIFSSPANLTINSDEITTLSNDPMLSNIDIKDHPWYKYVELDVILINRETTNAQIFWSKNGSGFSEENSTKFTLKNGKNYVRIFTEPSFDLLRFDPADEERVSLRINSITLTNRYSPKTFDIVKIVLLFLIVEALFFFLCFSAKGIALFKDRKLVHVN